jgi:hypothetical protein
MHDYRRILASAYSSAGGRRPGQVPGWPLAQQPSRATQGNPQITLSQGAQP